MCENAGKTVARPFTPAACHLKRIRFARKAKSGVSTAPRRFFHRPRPARKKKGSGDRRSPSFELLLRLRRCGRRWSHRVVWRGRGRRRRGRSHGLLRAARPPEIRDDGSDDDDNGDARRLTRRNGRLSRAKAFHHAVMNWLNCNRFPARGRARSEVDSIPVRPSPFSVRGR